MKLTKVSNDFLDLYRFLYKSQPGTVSVLSTRRHPSAAEYELGYLLGGLLCGAYGKGPANGRTGRTQGRDAPQPPRLTTHSGQTAGTQDLAVTSRGRAPGAHVRHERRPRWPTWRRKGRVGDRGGDLRWADGRKGEERRRGEGGQEMGSPTTASRPLLLGAAEESS